jgi:hypothetical protein
METPPEDEPVELILDDLESLQDLLDEELAALNIPLLDDVADPEQKAAFDERLNEATMALDFDEFIIEEELPDSLGLEQETTKLAHNVTVEETPPYSELPPESEEEPEPITLTQPDFLQAIDPPADALPATESDLATEEQLVLPPVADLNEELGLTEPQLTPNSAQQQSTNMTNRDELVATLVDRALSDLIDTLQPKLEAMCHSLLDETLGPSRDD